MDQRARDRWDQEADFESEHAAGAMVPEASPIAIVAKVETTKMITFT